MLANCYPGSSKQNNCFSRLSARLVVLESRLENEHLDRVVRLDRVIAQKRQHLATRESLDHRDRLIPERPLEDPAKAAHVILEVLVFQGPLRLGHRVVEDRDHDAVLDVGPGTPWTTAHRLLEERDDGTGDVPIQGAGGGSLVCCGHAIRARHTGPRSQTGFLAYILGMCSGWRQRGRYRRARTGNASIYSSETPSSRGSFPPPRAGSPWTGCGHPP